MERTILITGASKGIGLTCALGLKARGYRVFATSRKESDVLRLHEQGLESMVLDITDSNSIDSALKEILLRTNGKLDALFNNAGYGQPGAVEDLSRNLIRKQFETNVFGTIELTSKVIPIMRKQGHGKIISVSSLLGIITLPYRGAYNASKFALEGFTDTLRQELYDTNIKIVLIEPGPITSEFRVNAFKAFEEGIDPEHSVHKATYKKLADQYGHKKAKDPFTLPPTAVLNKLIAALETKNPKARYYVTFPAHLLPIFKRFLPTSAMDWISRKIG